MTWLRGRSPVGQRLVEKIPHGHWKTTTLIAALCIGGVHCSTVVDGAVTGMNDPHRPEYDPMCSKCPGPKTYHVTVYALSAETTLRPEDATRAGLLSAIDDIRSAKGFLTSSTSGPGANEHRQRTVAG